MERETLSLNDLLISPRFQKLAWLLQHLEGFRAKAYVDMAGNLTIGYGHEIIGGMIKDLGIQSLGLSFTQIQAGLSPELAFQLLAHDVLTRANIQKATQVPLSDPIWVALSSFCFNVGFSAFLRSHAFKFLASQDLYAMADSLSSWREVKGSFSPGIAKRRLCEALILMQKPLSLQSPALPSKQWGAPTRLTFLDDNWGRLSLAFKQEALDLYELYQQTFPSPVQPSSSETSSFSLQFFKNKLKSFMTRFNRSSSSASLTSSNNKSILKDPISSG